jgi:DNA-binding NtrC family response regulator
VAEDDASIRSFITAALRRDGHAIVVAEDAETALRLVDAGDRFDVLLTDLTMPGRSGIELAHEVRTRHPDVGIVLMTGWDLDGPVSGIPGRPIEQLRKPFDLVELSAAVGRARGTPGRAHEPSDEG